MADRTVKVSLILQAQGYFSGIDQVAQKTARVGSEIDKLNQKKAAFSQLGASAIGFGSAAALGVGLAVSKFSEFDQQMSYVQAATHETASNMNLLRDAALEAGARTVFSATEAAGAIEELAKAGVSTEDILSGGLDAALDLAAAGGLGVADAAGIAATALKTFNLEGRDMSHVADLLAAGAGKAMGDVSQLAQALAQGGQVAKSTGLSIEETTAGLSAFAAQGLLGSDAGTSFKSMLQRLTPQSDVARREMERLGISAYNASGNFIGLAEFAGNLEQSLKRLTPEQRNAALATIFGSDAVRAANVLYTEGEDGIRDWIEAVDDTGYAAETARIRLDNLAGDVEALGGALDTALIQSGSGANDALRSLVQIATGAVDIFTALPEPVQQSALYFGIAAAAVGLVGGAALVATPRIAEFKAITSAAGFSMRGLSLAAGGVTVGLTAVIAVVAALATAQAEARAKAQAYEDTLESGTQRITKATREAVVEQLAMRDAVLWWETSSAFDAADKLGISYDLVTDAALGSAEAIDELRRQVEEAGKAHTGSQDDYEAYESWVRTLTEAVSGESASLAEAARSAAQKEKALKSTAEASGEMGSAASDATSEIDWMAAATEDATDKLDTLSKALSDVGDSAINMGDALDRAYGSLNDLTEAAEQEGVTLAGTDDASIAFRDSIRDVEEAHRVAAASIIQNNGTLDEAKAKYGEGREAIIRMLEAKGLDRTQAEQWADANLGAAGEVVGALEGVATAVNNVPDNKAIEVALSGVDLVENALNDLVRPRYAPIRVVTDGTNIPQIGRFASARGNFFDYAGGGTKVKAFDTGGFASGIYAARAESIHKFAEPETIWEAYISGKPSDRERNQGIVWEAGSRLGMWESAPPQMAFQGSHTAVQAGPTYQFHGQFAMTPEELSSVFDRRMRLEIARTGLATTSEVT